MAKRLRIKTDGKQKNRISDSQQESKDLTSDGFCLKFVQGKGVVELSEIAIEFGIKVESLEMIIKDIAFPFDISQGIARLRSKRLTLSRLKISLSKDIFIASIIEHIEKNTWFTEPKIFFEKNFIVVSILYGHSDWKVPFSFRLVPKINKTKISLLIDEIKGYGSLPSPLLTIATAVANWISGESIEGISITIQKPVEKILMTVLPCKGWRLPSIDDIIVESFSLTQDICEICFVSGGTKQFSFSQNHDFNMEELKRNEELRICEKADELLARGEIEAARNIYLTKAKLFPDNEAIAARLAMVDIINPNSRTTIIDYLLSSFPGWKNRTDMLAVLAQSAAIEEDADAEFSYLKWLFEKSLPSERMEICRRMTTLKGQTNPEECIEYLEKEPLTKHIEPSLFLTLIKLYARVGDENKVASLLPRWIALHKESKDVASSYYEAGKIYSQYLHNHSSALTYYEKALIIRSDDKDSAWGLYTSLKEQGLIQKAIQGFEKLKEAYKCENNSKKAAQCLNMIGEIWLKKGEPDLAILRFCDALEEQWSQGTQIKLGQALLAQGRIQEALHNYEEALFKERRSDKEWGMIALKIARLYFSHYQDYDSALRWTEEAVHCDQMEQVSLQLKWQIFEKQNRWTELANDLQKKIIKEKNNLTNDPSMMETILRLSRARIGKGDLDSAISTLENALINYSGNDKFLDLYITALRSKKAYEKLIKALKKKFDYSSDAEEKEPIACELGQLYLLEFENSKEAKNWFLVALNLDNNSTTAHLGLLEALSRLGEKQLLKTQIDSLIACYEKKGETKKTGDLCFELAKIYLEEKNNSESILLFRKALPYLCEEKRQIALLEIADTHFKEEQWNEAKDMYKRARKGANQYENHLAALGEAQASFYAQDYENAYDAALAAGSGPAELRTQSALVLCDSSIHIGKTDETLLMLMRVAQNVSSKDAVLLLDKAASISWEINKNFEIALNCYEQILELDPKNDRAKNYLLSVLEKSGNRRLLANALVRFSDSSSTPCVDLQKAADFFMAEGYIDDAAQALLKSFETRPDPESAQMLIIALLRLDKLEEMLNSLCRASNENEDIAQVLRERVRLHGHIDILVKVLSRLRYQSPDKEQFRLIELASIYIVQKKYEECSDMLYEAGILKESPITLELFFQASCFAHKNKNYDLLFKCIKGIIPLVEKTEAGNIVLQYAQTFFRAKKTKMAISTLSLVQNENLPFERLYSVAVRNCNFKQLLILTKEKAQKEERWDELERLIKIQLEQETDEKVFPQLWYELGIAATKSRGIKNASLYFEKALEFDPEMKPAWKQIAEIAFLEQHWGRLSDSLEQLKKEPFDAKLEYWQATLNEQLGNDKIAIEGYKNLFAYTEFEVEGKKGVLRLANLTDHSQLLMDICGSFSDEEICKMPCIIQVKLGKSAKITGNYKTAQKYFEMTMGNANNELEALKELAQIYKNNGDYLNYSMAEEKLSKYCKGDEKIDHLVNCARVFLEHLDNSQRAHKLYMQAFSISNNEPDVLLGLADCAWITKDYNALVSNIERLRVIAPHLLIDPQRLYRFAKALCITKQWPSRDILELLEEVLPNLDNQLKQKAFTLIAQIKSESKLR